MMKIVARAAQGHTDLSARSRENSNAETNRLKCGMKAHHAKACRQKM